MWNTFILGELHRVWCANSDMCTSWICFSEFTGRCGAMEWEVVITVQWIQLRRRSSQNSGEFKKQNGANKKFFISCFISLCLGGSLAFNTWTLVIWKVPLSIKLIRPSFPRILWPSFSHWMLGRGLPMMWQCSWVVEPGVKVWLAGPWRMMGGTRSEGAVGTENRVRWFEMQTLNSPHVMREFPLLFGSNLPFSCDQNQFHCGATVCIAQWDGNAVCPYVLNGQRETQKHV